MPRGRASSHPPPFLSLAERGTRAFSSPKRHSSGQWTARARCVHVFCVPPMCKPDGGASSPVALCGCAFLAHAFAHCSPCHCATPRLRLRHTPLSLQPTPLRARGIHPRVSSAPPRAGEPRRRARDGKFGSWPGQSTTQPFFALELARGHSGLAGQERRRPGEGRAPILAASSPSAGWRASTPQERARGGGGGPAG